jgi:LuxR family maltose regulon positive regulatory protein
MVVAVSALVETHAGGGENADADRHLCRQHLTGLLDVAPWLNLQARVVLARAAHMRGNRVEAAALVDEAEATLEATPGADRVEEQLATLRRELSTRDTSQSFGPSSLTTAELRVLQWLPTHLSVAEIADRLYVSRNTVKSQTIAIYRKLGTSSRGGAVEIATAAGLLGDTARKS